MNYFKTTKPLAEAKSIIKSWKAYDYEYCLLAMKDDSTIVISNSEKLTHQLEVASVDFNEVSIPKKEIETIHQKQMYKATQGNNSLLLE
jgi:hypothetical protein